MKKKMFLWLSLAALMTAPAGAKKVTDVVKSGNNALIAGRQTDTREIVAFRLVGKNASRITNSVWTAYEGDADQMYYFLAEVYKLTQSGLARITTQIDSVEVQCSSRRGRQWVGFNAREQNTPPWATMMMRDRDIRRFFRAMERYRSSGVLK